MDDKDKTISRFTSDNPNNQTRETNFDATGVKDQNLYLENATLNIEGNLNIEDDFDAETLTVTTVISLLVVNSQETMGFLCVRQF
ncbi:Uncharacterised protein [Chlamydia abortus]|nr:Uncharacterised protein [Chlamydia abortus]SGA06009.1 Uncharacterised protein [Chlamydia abortus]SGA18578.1 Uncharacterised protein [Chlamydia abortus]SGA25884.1 Uncharacterised protein [Chlamydia abortus]SGA26912.1 Uncharacterised protein [Chlamydia abortus]